MEWLEEVNSALSGIILPIVLIAGGIALGAKLKFFFVGHPVRFLKDLKNSGTGDGTSPFKALSIALAGTLGVGNISGVATAITAGGAGALFWMWVSAAAAMSIKYAEVFLAVKYRETHTENGERRYSGGAYMYMKNGMSRIIGKHHAKILSLFFAFLLVSNSLLTGNIVQVNAASSVFEGVPPILCGAAFAVTVLAVTAGGVSRVGDFTVKLIPVLSAVYAVMSLIVITMNFGRLPQIFSSVLKSAFSIRAIGGGISGYGISRAMRFGVTRGVFSNEAGCGTAPTAHACADTRSPHHQGCLGIFEVFCDTVILCTMTALVILIGGVEGYDGIPLSEKAFGVFFGTFGETVIGISVIFFALATVICQSFYGMEALSYISGSKKTKTAYLFASFAASLAGSVISSDFMWQAADLEIALMTLVNTAAVLLLSKEVKPFSVGKIKRGVSCGRKTSPKR